MKYISILSVVLTLLTSGNMYIYNKLQKQGVHICQFKVHDCQILVHNCQFGVHICQFRSAHLSIRCIPAFCTIGVRSSSVGQKEAFIKAGSGTESHLLDDFFNIKIGFTEQTGGLRQTQVSQIFAESSAGGSFQLLRKIGAVGPHQGTELIAF